MPGLQLLELEPDKLFQQYAVSDIETLQKSIDNEIERKREELRTLVGERYRDLIDAADTIAEMKVLSEQVIEDVERMNTALAQLQKKHCVKPGGLLPKIDIPVKSTTHDQIAAQIKLLIDLPEHIWNALDIKDYVRASQLFLLARHIKTGFSVDKKLKEMSPKLTVLEQQWSTMSHFPVTILKAVERDLQLSDLSPKDCCNCLVAVALLENTPLLEKYLSLRTQALKSTLEAKHNVKASIIESHNVVINSLYALHYCFIEQWDGGKGIIWKMIGDNSSKRSIPVVEFLEPSIIFNYLPPIILQYRISPSNKCDRMTLSDIQLTVLEWLDLIKGHINSEGKHLLSNITSLRSLHLLTNMNFKMDPEWFQVLKSLEIADKLNLWNDLYRPLINIRAKDLISLHWEDAFREIVEHLNGILNDETTKKPESDLRWFVWKEAQSDLIDKSSDKNIPKALWLKAKGISPRVSSVCTLLQNQLESLYKDVNELCNTEDILTSDTKQLRSHQQSACLNIVLRLKELIRELVNRDDINETKLCILARFLQAIPELCPALQKCLTLAEENKVNAWHEAKTLLNAESLSCWVYWEDMTALRFEKIITQLMKTPTTYADLLNTIPQWDIIVIDEGGEGEERVHKSQLKIPSCPSLSLQITLNFICADMSKAYIPRLVNENLMQKLVRSLVEFYNIEPLCQAQALQNLLDVKFLLTQFVPASNKELTNKFHQVITFVESKIDPFDLDVFSPHIHNNVKSSIQRFQSIYGTVIYYSEVTGTCVKIAEDPCIISLSKTSANVWFPPLPVTNPANRPLQIMKTKASKSVKQSMESNSGEALSKGGGTTSFFTDWFS